MKRFFYLTLIFLMMFSVTQSLMQTVFADDAEDEVEESESDSDFVVDDDYAKEVFAMFMQHEDFNEFIDSIDDLIANVKYVHNDSYGVDMPQVFPGIYLEKTSKYDEYVDVPSGMEFYIVKPTQDNAHVVFGVNEDFALLFNNEPFFPVYSSLSEYGVELEVEDLEDAFGESEKVVQAVENIYVTEYSYQAHQLTNEHFAKVWAIVNGTEVPENETFIVREQLTYVYPDLRNQSYLYPNNTYEIRATESEEVLVFTLTPDGSIRVYEDVPYHIHELEFSSIEETENLVNNFEVYHMDDAHSLDLSGIIEKFE